MKKLKLILISLLTLSFFSCDNNKHVSDLNGEMFNGIEFRSIGPGNYAGRISEILVHPQNDSIIYVSPSTGGVFKTLDKGSTWSPIFDKAGKSLAIGDMDISNNTPDLIWVGTGEASGEQNPASVGDGIYKSEDGGKSWKNMGLIDSRHFSKIVIHPTKDNIVFAGATGGRWGADEDRGVYKTEDGGLSWDKVLFVNNNTGISDLLVHPDGETVFASAWEQRRSAWAHVRMGPASGIYMSNNGGSDWEKLKNGLPTDNAGRIALALSESNTDIIYACYEHDSLGLFRSEDKGLSWTNVNNKVSTSYWYGRIYVDPVDSEHIYIMGTYIQESRDGGKSFSPVIPGRGVHVDHHVLWIDPENTDNKLLGNDGGLYSTDNDGMEWQFIANLPIGQYYDISVDDRDPYWIYGGLQDNGVWGGPSRSENGSPVSNGDIVFINGGDGFYSDTEPENQAIVYGESQYGFIVKYDHISSERKRIKPRSEEGDDKYRFNWNSPFFISRHQPYELYMGAQKLLKSSDKGDSWTEISEDLTGFFELDTLKVIGQKPSLKPYFTITALAESPIKKGLIYAGTDDGNLHLTKDGGTTWKDISGKIPAPENRFFSRIVVSMHEEGKVYIGFGRFYEANDLSPYIFMSLDYGETWADISGNMPEKSVIRSIYEHHINPDLLFAGTHNSFYVSLNNGNTWTRPETNMPYLAIDDIELQERENDLVLGSYGRGLWVLDNIAFLSEMNIEKLNEDQILFEPKLIESKIVSDSIFVSDEYEFIAPEPGSGIMISYYLKRSYDPDSRKKPELSISGSDGETVFIDGAPTNLGFNRLLWEPENPGVYEIVLTSRNNVSTKTIEVK